jgi:peptide-methionine (S)-S-oxide reductase
VTFDPSQVSYGELLRIFFSVAHDPTQLNSPGAPTVGTQYRSAIFYANDEQKRVAQAYIAQLSARQGVHGPIVTQVVALPRFYPGRGLSPGLPREASRASRTSCSTTCPSSPR